MIRFFNWLGQLTLVCPIGTPARKRSRLNLEVLEGRCLLSLVGSVVDHDGLPHFYAIDAHTHQMEEFQPVVDHFAGNYDIQRVSLDGPQVDAVSGGLDREGRAVVYSRTRGIGMPQTVQVKTGNGTWYSLGKPAGEGVTEICGGLHGAVFAIGTSGNVYVNSWDGTPTTNWQALGSPRVHATLVKSMTSGFSGRALAVAIGGVSQISVATGYSGKDQVFAIGADQAIYAYDTGDNRGWQLVDNSASFRQISATQNAVYAIDSIGRLHHDTGHLHPDTLQLQPVNIKAPSKPVVNEILSYVWDDSLITEEFFLPDGTLDRFRSLSVGKLDDGEDVLYAVDFHGFAVEYIAGQAPHLFRTNIEQISGTDLGWWTAVTGPVTLRTGSYFSNTADWGNHSVGNVIPLWEIVGDEPFSNF
jgi:hypothetical protein